MNLDQTPYGYRRATACALLLATACYLPAQSTPPSSTSPANSEDEPIVLSPFTVDAEMDAGWDSRETLAGAGLRTPLSDIASAISVVTPEFFADTASTSLRDVLVYQANIEVGGMGGNAALAYGTTEPSMSNNASTRVRGLASATKARNFFRTDIPTDSYNAGRLDINRGTNALLFGVASPAGIINYATQGASVTKDSGKVSVLVDNFDRLRETINLNKVLIDGQLGLRIAAVNDDRKFKQEPAYNHSKRIYGALEWRIKALERGILSGTTIRVNFEKGAIDANNPRTLPPQDRVSSWFEDTIQPEVSALGIAPKVTYDPYVPFSTTVLNDNGWGVQFQTNRSPVVVFPDPGSATPLAPTDGSSGQNVVARPYVSSRYYFAGINRTGTAAHVATNSFQDILFRRGVEDAVFYAPLSITDPAVFDYNNTLLEGPNKEEWMRFSSQNVTLEQLFLDGAAGIEVAYDAQRAKESRRSTLPEDLSYIAIDVNERMWDGSANPNFGRAFTSASGDARYEESERETLRAKAFYTLDLSEKTSARWGRILGRHTFSALYQEERTDYDRRTGRMFSIAEPWLNGNSQNRFSDSGKLVNTLVYLSSPLFDVTNPGAGDIGGVTAARMDLASLLNGNGVFLSRNAPSSNAAAQLPEHAIYYDSYTVIGSDRELTEMASGANKSRLDLTSQAFAQQSYFLDEQIVTMFGWRREQAENKLASAPTAPGGEGYRLVNDPSYDLDREGIGSVDAEETLFAWSVVAKVPRGWLAHTPFDSLSFFYGESNNFDPPQSRAQTVFGEELPPAAGSSLDYGFTFDALDGRLSIRTNFFETNQTNTRNSDLSSATLSIMERHRDAFDSVVNGFNADIDGDGFPDGYVAPPQAMLDLFGTEIDGNTLSFSSAGVIDTSDYTSKGVEIETTFRPTRNLSIMLNVARQQSVRTNSGQNLRTLLYDTPLANGQTLAEAWDGDAARNIALTIAAVGDPNASGTLRHSFNLHTLNPFNRVVLADGGPASELREWRVNSSARYSFRDGVLKGLGLGGAVRWQGAVAIGYPIVAYHADGTPVGDGPAESTDFRSYDIANPYYGPEDWNFDSWVSYVHPIFNDSVDLKIQLNVRNLLGDDDLIPVVAQPDGSTAIYRIASPRTFTLTTTFSF